MIPVSPFACLTAAFVCAVILIWRKLHCFAANFAEVREMLTATPVSSHKLRAIDDILSGRRAPAVYTPPAVRVEFVEVAPMPIAGSYRDDTGAAA